ncbi:protein TolB [Oxobacter pfennigii]|uniref:Protein TolB n=1 Tax=Oxobacter pfennigii TaxID=36849 RepID=A0A0P8W536_9CLOT|nr:WD40 repeat domain-containing protein [Oxobacter pfennigii]KPU42983.1 protein TolB [Oxobacter pfennigii]
MKQPLTLLFGIIISILFLSIAFPADPMQPDLITRIAGNKEEVKTPLETVRNYRVGDVTKIDDAGTALIFSPDEEELYYTKKSDDNSYEEIWISNLKDYKGIINTKLKINDIRNAKWSPDGKQLCFMGDLSPGTTSLFTYSATTKLIKEVTPKNIKDMGVTSYDWDNESLYLVMSVDIVKPFIELYNTHTGKFSRVNLKLRSCRNVAFYEDDKLMYSDLDENNEYKIYTVEKSGKNAEFIADGQSFILSPNKNKMAILADLNSQQGLWIYNIINKNIKQLRTEPINNIVWLSDNTNIIFAEEDDCKSKYTYSGSLYYVENNLQETEITGTVYPIFTASESGRKIAMTSPDYVEDRTENKGIFAGTLFK